MSEKQSEGSRQCVGKWWRSAGARLRHIGRHDRGIDEPGILAHRIGLLYRGFPTAIASSLLISVFMVAALWGRTVPQALLAWLGAAFTLAWLRLLLVRRYHASQRTPPSLRLWEKRFAAGAAAAGALWGLTPWLFIPRGDDTAAMVVVVLLAGVSASASAVLAPSRRTVMLFLLPALLPLAGWMFWSGGRAHLFMGAAILFHIAVLLAVARLAQTMVWNALRAGTENERLQGAIAAERRLAEEREKTVVRLLELERENTLFRIMVERAHDLIVVVHDAADRGRIVYANDAACRHFGTSRETLLTWYPPDFDPHVDSSRVTELIAALQRKESVVFESEHRKASGELIPVEVILHPLEQAGRLLCLSYVRDIRARKAQEQQRRQYEAAMAREAAEEQLRHLLDNAPDIIVRYDRECRRIYSNAAHARTVGRPTQLGKTPVEDWAMPTGPEVAVAYQAHLCEVLVSGQPVEWELDWTAADGSPVCYLVRGVPEFDREGQVLSVLAFAREISARKRLELAVLAREQEFRALVENSPDFVTRFDRECRRTYINPSLAAILEVEEALGKRPTEYYPGSRPAEEYEARVRRVVETGEECVFLFDFSGKGGRQYRSDMRIVPERDGSGSIIGVLAIGRDISERLRLEEEMRRQASYDTLTGLPNRRLFGDRLREEIAKAGRSGDNVALLFIDLDRFKEVNDTLGHEIGDQLLVEAARRIHACVRASDTVARLGGDEFVAILPGIPDIAHLGSVAQGMIDAVAQPYSLGEHLAYVSASIGIASYPLDADGAEALVSCADQAMYAAKEQGRNGFGFFTASMQAQAEGRLRLANDLRGALAGRQLQVHYQPIVDIASGRVVKAEALLRWRHPVHGMVPPDRFIPVAEETGAIHEIGDWVFREAVKVAGRWREQRGGAGVQVSVNISPRQFVRDQACANWIGYLAEARLPAECMAIEITEGLLLGDQAGILEKLGMLRAAGIQVALDDFGTGYSAMAYLKKFPIDYLKIDRSFVRDLATDESDRAIAEAIIVMAHKLGLQTIAEGVETADQRDMLAAVGCEYLQGYLYARPMTAEEFLKYALQAEMEAVE